MYINRVLLLVVGLALMFFPSVEAWLLSDYTAWYRPYQLWMLTIVGAWWNQRSRYPDEL